MSAWDFIFSHRFSSFVSMHMFVASSLSPVRPCHLLTAKRRLAVTVMMAGDVRPAWVLAATCVTGELDGNFSTMITSCCICSVNIRGVCRRRYCSGPRDRRRDEGERRGNSRGVARRTKSETQRWRKQLVKTGRKTKTQGDGGKRRPERTLGGLRRIVVSSS